MTADFEFEGKNVEHAAKSAARKLNIPLNQLKYDVISYGSTGIFGLVGAKKAKIRVLAASATPKTNGTPPRSQAKKAAAKPRPKEVEPKRSAQASPPPAAVEINEEMVQRGHEGLLKIVQAITEDSQIETAVEADRLLYKVQGGNSGLLIGKRGQTLEAIQYLVDKMVNAQGEPRIRVQVDVEGYLEKRTQHLKRLAVKMGDKARRTGKPVALGIMNAQDRRIVHVELKDSKDVRTQSMGEGYYRKLIIYPKRSYHRRKPGREAFNRRGSASHNGDNAANNANNDHKDSPGD